MYETGIIDPARVTATAIKNEIVDLLDHSEAILDSVFAGIFLNILNTQWRV